MVIDIAAGCRSCFVPGRCRQAAGTTGFALPQVIDALWELDRFDDLRHGYPSDLVEAGLFKLVDADLLAREDREGQFAYAIGKYRPYNGDEN